MNPLWTGFFLGAATLTALSICGLAWMVAFSTGDDPELWAPHQRDGDVIDLSKYRRGI